MSDLIFGITPFAVVFGLLAIYTVRVLRNGRARSTRADRDGGSILLSMFLVEFGMWMLMPVGRMLARFGATPDGVTWFSLVPGVGAGLALSVGQFGLATLLGTIAAFCDTVDGIVARLQASGSEAGETLDAIIDRYLESAFFLGLLYHYRFSAMMTVTCALALIGAFMVSYTSAKAEAQRVDPPRGLMRRSERGAYLLVGTGLVPFTRLLVPDSASPLLREAPLVAVIVIIAVLANISSVQRVAAIRRALQRAAASSPSPSVS